MRRIIFVNRKGGSGKTTVVVNLAYHLAQKKRRVLVVDLDSQGHSTFIMARDPQTAGARPSGEVGLEQGIQDWVETTLHRGLDLLPLAVHHKLLNREVEADPHLIQRGMVPLLERYDYWLFDLPPSLEPVVTAGLLAATEIMVPLQTHFLPLQGMAQLIGLMRDLAGEQGHELRLTGIIPTLYNPRTRLYQQVLEDIAGVFGKSLILPGIPYDIRLAEAPSHRQVAARYAPRSRGSVAFGKLAAAVLAMEAK